MSASNNPFDYNQLAGRFDRFLPQIQPVGAAVLARLPKLADRAAVVDIACGTGEPGLTLALNSPAIRLLGVDQAEAMVGVAQSKADKLGLSNARFSVMPMHALTLPDASVDAAISRFGLLMFGDVPASARELARVLRPGAPFSLAVWDDPAANTLVSSLLAILREYLPAGHTSPMDGLRPWAVEGRRLHLLESLGFATIQTEMFQWDYRFDSFEGPWSSVQSMDKFTGQADLDAEKQEAVRRALIASLAPYCDATGRYVIPHACRIIWGTR